MDQIIYKYQCPITDEVIINMPRGARVLCVQMQYGVPKIWALVPTNPHGRLDYKFYWVGTGNPAGHVDGDRYVGTIQTPQNEVYHLFAAGAL